MAAVSRRAKGVEVDLAPRERGALLHIVDTLAAGLVELPAAYDDADLDREYRRLVAREVEQVRDTDVAVLRDSIRDAGAGACCLDEAQALAWVRALNHLRRAAGAMLGATHDGWEEDADPATLRRDEYAMLTALTWLQDSIVDALES